MSDLIDALHSMTSASGERALAALAAAMSDLLREETATHAERSLAAGVLGEIGAASALEGLRAALDDPHVTVRYTAVGALIDIGTQAAVTAVRGLLNDPDPGIRRMVLFALVEGQFAVGADPDEFAPFLADKDPSVRRQAVLALRQAAHPDGFPHLLAHLQDPDSRVALAAAAALGKTAHPDALEPLMAVAADETAYYLLRGEAIAALASMRLPGIITRLTTLLNDPDVYICERVVAAVYTLETPEQVAALMHAADRHTMLVRPVRDALVRCGGQVVEAAMIDALDHLRVWVRSLAVEVLGELRTAEAPPDLLRALSGDVPQVRLLAANALGQIGLGGAAVEGLQDALNDPDWLVEMAAASALRRINTPEARAVLRDWHSARGEDSPGL